MDGSCSQNHPAPNAGRDNHAPYASTVNVFPKGGGMRDAEGDTHSLLQETSGPEDSDCCPGSRANRITSIDMKARSDTPHDSTAGNGMDYS
jgi:hypothetical protein